MHQFAPFYEVASFRESDTLRDFDIGNFYVALRKDRIVGVMGVWDQSKYKQSIVVGYSGRMKLIRPFYNLYAHLRRSAPLPQPGEQLRSFFGAFVAIESKNPEILSLLIDQMYQDWAGKGYHYFLIGLPTEDPLVHALTKYRHMRLDSTIYVVYWKDGETSVREVDDRPPHLEIATL